MISAQRFLFNRDFEPDSLGDAGIRARRRAGDGKPSNDRKTASYSEDDLARVRAEGFAEGRDQASREMAQSIELRVSETFEAVGEHLSQLISTQEKANADAARAASAVAVAIARRMVPELHRRNALAEIEHTVDTVLAQVLETAELTVRVAASLGETLSERLAALAEARGLDRRIRVAADPDMTEGDCRIEWAGGGAERNSAVSWSEIDAVIERNLGAVATLPAGDAAATEPDEANTPSFLVSSTNEPPRGTEAGENHG